jgi:hypothetical protein
MKLISKIDHLFVPLALLVAAALTYRAGAAVQPLGNPTTSAAAEETRSLADRVATGDAQVPSHQVATALCALATTLERQDAALAAAGNTFRRLAQFLLVLATIAAVEMAVRLWRKRGEPPRAGAT